MNEKEVLNQLIHWADSIEETDKEARQALLECADRLCTLWLAKAIRERDVLQAEYEEMEKEIEELK